MLHVKALLWALCQGNSDVGLSSLVFVKHSADERHKKMMCNEGNKEKNDSFLVLFVIKCFTINI